jgi:hypothetical protein
MAALFAALIGMSISLLFLRAPLSATSRALYEKRNRHDADEDVEDSATDEE